MDFDLKEMVVSLMVGGFTLLGIEAITYYYFNKSITGFFDGVIGPRPVKANQHQEYPVALVALLAAAIPVGVVIENFSLQVAEENPEILSSPISLATKILNSETVVKIMRVSIGPLESKERLRSEAIYSTEDGLRSNSKICRDLPRNDEDDCKKATPLGREMARQKLFSLVCGNDTDFESRLLEGNFVADKVMQEKMDGCIKSVFYESKNSVYRKRNYYEEMHKIDLRRRLAASFSLTAILLLVPAIYLSLIRVVLFSRALESIGSNRHGLKRNWRFWILLTAGSSMTLTLMLAIVLGASADEPGLGVLAKWENRKELWGGYIYCCISLCMCYLRA